VGMILNILVIDVPAETSGALSILENFHKEVLESLDENNKWYFVLSTPSLSETDNIEVLRFPWVKKSWFHRLFFDYFVAPKLIKKYNIDYVFSLQNTAIHFTKKPQIVYLHQILPFIEKKYKFVENPKFWIYQNLISKYIIKSMKKAIKVIVQGEWLKREISKISNVDEKKIEVVRPTFSVPEISLEKLKLKDEKKIFFYPATEFEYKNHHLILDALDYLIQSKEIDCNELEVIFTLSGEENEYSSKLKRNTIEKSLPIKFIGSIDKLTVFEYYHKSTLIFPSYIEAFGLPLLEAKLCNSTILGADMPYSKEILSTYDNAYFFSYKEYRELAKLIKMVVNNEITKKKSRVQNECTIDQKGLLNVVIQAFSKEK